MRIRFRFKKTGRLKYIGHLDLLNVWNRALKAAKLPVSYSKGFNPHMLVSFAAPLPLGIESVSEYVDIDFEGDFEVSDATERLNARFPEGLEVTGAYGLTPPLKRIAAIVETAKYCIIAPFEISQAQIDEFMSQESIEIVKKTKRHNDVTDIKPDIFGVTKTDSGIEAVLSCGSARNLKPTLFMLALSRFLDKEVPSYRIKIIRAEILSRDDNGYELALSVI